MDPIDPILPHLPEPAPVQRAGRVQPTHRDGRGGGRHADEHRREEDADAVHCDIEGLSDVGDAGTDVPTTLPELPAHHIDLSA